MKNLTTQINWNKSDGLVPAIIQDANTSSVLMLGYMSKQSLAKTIKTKKVWFYSRSKKRLWMKGEASKNILNVVDIKLDCDSDAMLVKALPSGPTCHTGEYSCFKEDRGTNPILNLFATIQGRKNKMPENSYTTSLFKSGSDKICLKVAEEGLEVIQAARKETKKRLIEESVDLIYHLFVLLAEKNVSLVELNKETSRREKS